jgi:outer membrane protein assembly factor BamD
MNPYFAGSMLIRILILLLFAALIVPPVQAQRRAAVPGEQAVAAEGPPAGEPSADLAAAQALDASGATAQAIDAYRRVARNHQFTAQGATAQFRVAEILWQTGDVERAFQAFNRYISDYPESIRFDEAIRAQIEIANTFLDGRRVRFLGLPIVAGFDRAAEMYAAIVAAAPFSKYAPMAQFNLGLARERQGRTKEAIQAYQTVMDRYPASPVAASALYQIGYVYMRQGLRGRSEDMSALILARNAFEDYLMFFPRSEKAEQARENLLALQSRETGDLYGIARFYDRSRDFRAAFIYYNEVIRRNPNSQDAELARIRIDELRADYGDDALRTGPERVETGERVALRRRLQAQVETPSLADYAGPPRDEIVREELPVVRPRLRTEARDIAPLPPVEPDLPMP